MASIFLGVVMVAIMLVGLLGIYNRVNANIKTQSLQATLNAFEAEIRRGFANAPQFTNEAYQTIFASRMPVTALRGAQGAEVIVTPWGGVITGSGGATVGTAAADNTQFWLRVEDLPQSACETVAASYLNNRNVVNVSVGSGATVAAVTTRVAIEGGCDGTIDDNTIGVVFRG